MKNAAVFVLPFFAVACSSRGPVVPVPPTVHVSQLESQLITPEGIRFVGKVVIKNQMRADLSIERVDWGVDLHDSAVADNTFTKLHPMRSKGTQTVTIPFLVDMSDIIDQAVDVLDEEAVRVRFRGFVCPVSFEPIPFEETRTVPIPKIPAVSIDGAHGSPMEGVFKVFLRIKNANDFPLALESIDSYVSINDKRYDLLRSDSFTELGPGKVGKITLTMKSSRGRVLSVALNVVRSDQPQFEIGGSFSCGSPYGRFQVPLSLRSGPSSKDE